MLVTNPAPPRKFYPGPVIAKIETLFTYVTRDSHANWVGTLHGVDPNMHFMGHLIYTPLVTLHNPYNISLSFDSFEVIIRNPPVAFNFYVNNQPQSSKLVPLTDMFVYGSDRTEKSFALKIANWSRPSASNPSGQIVMKPGQTLVCGPYLNPRGLVQRFEGNLFLRLAEQPDRLQGRSERFGHGQSDQGQAGLRRTLCRLRRGLGDADSQRPWLRPAVGQQPRGARAAGHRPDSHGIRLGAADGGSQHRVSGDGQADRQRGDDGLRRDGVPIPRRGDAQEIVQENLPLPDQRVANPGGYLCA